jgi:hypothetical protein
MTEQPGIRQNKQDCFSPISGIFAALVENYNKKYSLGQTVIIEEKFEAFRG